MLLKYYLGSLYDSMEIPEQSIQVRKILLNASSKDSLVEVELFDLLEKQGEIHETTKIIINKCVLMGFGVEYAGLYGADWGRKANFFKKLNLLFPDESDFAFNYCDMAVFAGRSPDDFYPILKQGILNDKEYKFYPSSDVFDEISESKYSFEFDLLLFENHLKPGSREEFNESLNELKAKHNTPNYLEKLEAIRWTEN
ncbi:MAG TPA: hypothetical protein DCS93_00935 [Microscillaceae bacterium]|nr:hypothetical protein [Microscillaceae bacterium]